MLIPLALHLGEYANNSHESSETVEKYDKR